MVRHVKKKIIGPIFFNGRLNSETYLDIILKFAGNPEIEDRYCWFQQDGATCHTSARTMENFEIFSEID